MGVTAAKGVSKAAQLSITAGQKAIKVPHQPSQLCRCLGFWRLLECWCLECRLLFPSASKRWARALALRGECFKAVSSVAESGRTEVAVILSICAVRTMLPTP